MNRIKEDLVKLYNEEISWGECNSTYTEDEIREYRQSPLPSSLNVYVDFDKISRGIVISSVSIPLVDEREHKKIMLLQDGRVILDWDSPAPLPLPFIED